MPPQIENLNELSTDAKYLLEMAEAISKGYCSVDLANKKPGKICHARWLTKASRILRLYVTTNKPSHNLYILAIYVMKVYIPMWFNIKYYNSVIYGSVLLSNFIRYTNILPDNLRAVVNEVVSYNSYFAHSENVLLSMFFDKRKPIRLQAYKKIMYIRDNLQQPGKLRPYVKPQIRFNCSDYTNMIDLTDDSILFEPPFTMNIPYQHLLEYVEMNLDTDDTHEEDTTQETEQDTAQDATADPGIPCHIQATERHVQLLTGASKRVIDKNKSGFIAATLESREKRPKFETKSDWNKQQ